MNELDLRARFTQPRYEDPKGADEHKLAFIRNQYEMTAQALNDAAPDCREKDLALSNLEVSLYWASEAIAKG